MSVSIAVPVEKTSRRRVDERRGRAGMRLFIVSEALLSVLLFFAYFYLRSGAPIWGTPPPKLTLALLMLAVLLSSSAVLHWGQRRVEHGDARRARWSLWGASLLGGIFLVIQSYEYADRLREIRPSTNAYGSIFYTITSLHGIHVVLGILMKLYVSALPTIVRPAEPPHRPLENVAEYWHFVDVVWIMIVVILYAGPRFSL
jgi:heme/copper-type cytochrome/quinol oxidase subunit 3